jgi:glycosyltransferase involved in cell wall biosynthesis
MATIAIDVSRAAGVNKTGVEWYSYYLVKELLKIPTNNKYILYSRLPLPADLFSGAQANYQEKILSWPLKYLWTVLRLSLQILIDKPDILFVPAHNLPLILPKKSLLTWHDIGYRRWPNYYSFWQKISLKFGEKTMNRASKIITVSNFSKKEIIALTKINSNKIQVVPLAVDYSIFYPRSADDQEKILFKFNIKKPFLLIIGRLEEKKNLVKIINAFTAIVKNGLNDAQIVLVGNPGFGYEKIVAVINSSTAKQQIIKLGWLSVEQLAALYSASNGLVFATNYEGFGMPVLEARACGKQVIISNNTAAVELATEHDLLVDPNSEKEIANAMVSLFSYKDAKTIYSSNKNYSWAITAKKTLEVIETII